MLTSPNGSKQKEDCTIQFFLLRRYNDYRQSKSKDTNPFRNSRTFKIKNDYIIGCAILFSQLDEWKKIRRDPKDPQPTNTSNGESYDPPNRLNGCFTAGGDGE